MRNGIKLCFAFVLCFYGIFIFHTQAYAYEISVDGGTYEYDNVVVDYDGLPHTFTSSMSSTSITPRYTYTDEDTLQEVTSTVKPYFKKMGNHSVKIDVGQSSSNVACVMIIPAMPQNVKVNAYGQTFEVTCDPVYGAESYYIDMWLTDSNSSGDFRSLEVVDSDKVIFYIDDVVKNSTYKFYLQACAMDYAGKDVMWGSCCEYDYKSGENTSVSVTYNPNGGTVSSTSQSVMQNSELSSLPIPSRTDYTFDGWFTAASGGTQVVAPVTIRQATTLYAHWTKSDTVTVSYNANGGKCSTSKASCDSDDTLTSLPIPTRSGYTFAGWYTAAEGGTKVTDSTKITDSMTLYAHWNKDASAKKAKLSAKSAKLLKGQKLTLKLNGASGGVKWKTSNKKIATVKNGKVTAKKKGKATITATYKGKSYKCKVKVEAPTLSASKLSIGNGSTSTLKLKGTTYKVKYRSDNKKVAKVSSKGVITAVSEGSAKVSAYANGKAYTCKVTVTKPNTSKVVTCPTCGGRGTVTCGTCNGNKTITRSHYNMKTMKTETKTEGCGNCGGKGSVTCGTCHGNRVIKK